MIQDLEQSDSFSVLVVEDDAGLRTLFTALLKRDGFLVECVNDGAQALTRLERASYSVVLLDLMMPVKNGFDVLQRFADWRPALLRQTIVTTGVSERELAKVDRSSVFAVLRKPFDIDCLIATVKDCAHQNGNGGSGGGLSNRRDGDGKEPKLDSSVRRFEAALPELRKILTANVACDHELMLRHELRRVVGKLGGVLGIVASVESDVQRAQRYEQLGRAASKLAGSPAQPGPSLRSG